MKQIQIIEGIAFFLVCDTTHFTSNAFLDDHDHGFLHRVVVLNIDNRRIHEYFQDFRTAHGGFRHVELPGQLQLYVSSSAHSCPPDPPPFETAGHSSLSVDG